MAAPVEDAVLNAKLYGLRNDDNSITPLKILHECNLPPSCYNCFGEMICVKKEECIDYEGEIYTSKSIFRCNNCNIQKTACELFKRYIDKGIELPYNYYYYKGRKVKLVDRKDFDLFPADNYHYVELCQQCYYNKKKMIIVTGDPLRSCPKCNLSYTKHPNPSFGISKTTGEMFYIDDFTLMIDDGDCKTRAHCVICFQKLK